MANFNCNKVFLGGRLTADPEMQQTQSGVPVCRFSIAVNRRGKRDDTSQPTADFFNVTAWRTTGEFVAKYFKKGSSIFVVGQLQIRTWTDASGNKRSSVDVVADEVSFVDSRSDAQGAEAGAGAYIPTAYQNAPQTAQNAPTSPTPAIEDVGQDEDLPF